MEDAAPELEFLVFVLLFTLGQLHSQKYRNAGHNKSTEKGNGPSDVDNCEVAVMVVLGDEVGLSRAVDGGVFPSETPVLVDNSQHKGCYGR